MYLCKSFLLLVLTSTVWAWDGDELEVFDVVEEVNQNFYTLLGITRDADGAAIKKAFRRLSLVLHPDKNDSPDAEVQFRQLVSVYDVLKEPGKRKCYDNVLDNGLPDWKQAVYYYRRVRKMGLREMAVILFVIISIGQYLLGWANYFEKKLTVEDYLNSKSKKLKKLKKGKGDAANIKELDEIESILVKPSLKDTLPCQVPRWLWWLFVSAPPLLYQTARHHWQQQQLQKQQLQQQQQEESEEEPEVFQRAPRKRKTFVLPEIKDDPTRESNKTTSYSKPTTPPVISGGLWTDDDLLDLAKLVKKYPVGTTERWEKIGEAMNRPASEVAHMAHKLKDNVLKNLAQKKDSEENGSSEEEDAAIVEEPKKVKTRGGKIGDVGESNIGLWNQVQQKALEAALAKFPKGAANDRWVKIAKCVPGKTKEECMLRYKYIVDMVKKKKSQDDSELSCDANQETEGVADTALHNGVDSKENEINNENGESVT